MSYWYYTYTLKNDTGFCGKFDSVACSIDNEFPIIYIKSSYEYICNEEPGCSIMVDFAVRISEGAYVEYCKRFLTNDR